MDEPIRGTLFEDEVFQNDTIINPGEFYQLNIKDEMAIKIVEDCLIEAAFPKTDYITLFCGQQKNFVRVNCK